MSGTVFGRLNGLCRKRSTGEGFELRPLFPLIVLTAALAQGTSISAPQGAATPLHEVAMPLHEVAMPLHEVAMPLHEVAMPLHEVAMPPREAAVPAREAAARENSDIVLLIDVPLIAACANPLALASLDNSPLHWAACNQDPTVLGPLIEAGADLETWNLHGLTPLQLAAYINPNPTIVRTLLESGADVNSRTYRGETPLHLAARNNTNPAVIHVLLDAGVDIGAVTDDGWTAWDLVQENPDLKGIGARLRPR